MNKNTKRVLAGCLAVSLCAGLAGYTAYADSTKTGSVTVKNTRETSTSSSSTEKTDSTKATSSSGSSKNSITKDETVYVLANADGSTKKIIVSDWLQNSSSQKSIKDESNLTDIENVKGDETFTQSGKSLTWDADGDDIYYQGTSDSDLPVDIAVSYKLDGKSVTADELKGKSGKVTIRFDYTNNEYQEKEINGKKEKIYVPFVMLTGTLLDTDTFTNVEVSNGKVINDGSHTIVVGFALPGMQESLNLDSIEEDSDYDIDLPDYVEITADTTDFELSTTITLASNDALGDIEDKVGDVDSSSLTDSMDELTDAMDQLMDGSSELYDGLATLLDSSEELVSGVNQLADGASQLDSGASELVSGANQLSSGASSLSSGLSQLSANSASLNSGAKQVFTSLLSTANTQLKAAGLDVQTLTISNYSSVLTGVISSLDSDAVYAKALAQVTAAVEKNRSTVTEKVTEAVREQVEAQVTEAVRAEVEKAVTAAVREQVEPQVEAAVRAEVKAAVIQQATGLSVEVYEAAVAAGKITAEQRSQVEAAIEAQMASDTIKAKITENTDVQMATDAVKSQISQNVEAQMASDDIKAKISENTEAQMASDTVKSTISTNVEAQIQKLIADNMASEEVQSQLSAASEGAQQVMSLKTSLDSYNAFYMGLQTYTAGVDSAASGAASLNSGASSLASGASSLKSGTSELYSGIAQLQSKMPNLIDGVTQLKDGAMELSDGLKQLNDEGIEKIVDLLEGDLEGLTERISAVRDVAGDYNNFSGLASGMDGKVEFIYTTDSIEND